VKRFNVVVAAALVAGLAVAAPASATYPGGNGQIAFHSFSAKSLDIYVVNPDGTYATNLTRTDDVHEAFPAFSPDGTRIAYERGRGRRADIWVMGADGSGQTQLTSGIDDDRYPAWSPDGTRIAFVRTDDDTFESDIYIMNADGTGLQRLTNSGDVFLGRIAWRPGANSIAFAVIGGEAEGYASQLASVDVGTGTVTRITNEPGIDHYDPDYSPDGSKIVYIGSGEQGYPYQPYVINADGSGKTRLTSAFDFVNTPVWSPDGTRIIFGTYLDSGLPIIAHYSPSGQSLGNVASEGYSLSWQPCSGDCRLTEIAPSDIFVTPYSTRKRTTIFASITPVHPQTDVKIVVYKRKDGRWKKVVSGTPSTGANGTAKLRFDRIKRGRCKAVASWAGDADHTGATSSVRYRCGNVLSAG
jgi:dipeptidyl aminopeptidase/acylaminoacyl peptidase